TGVAVTERPPMGMTLATTKMGLHEWAYKNDYNPGKREKMKHVDLVERMKKLNTEVELGFSP
ncbi:MAG: FAD-dependent oxidoreductase, partial [Polyangiaceae bacterium]